MDPFSDDEEVEMEIAMLPAVSEVRVENNNIPSRSVRFCLLGNWRVARPKKKKKLPSAHLQSMYYRV